MVSMHSMSCEVRLSMLSYLLKRGGILNELSDLAAKLDGSLAEEFIQPEVAPAFLMRLTRLTVLEAALRNLLLRSGSSCV